MGRKAYHQIVKTRVEFLQINPMKMLRLGQKEPSDRELGDVFLEVCRRIEQEEDGAIRRAFDDCELDLDNPFHWGDLMRVFCELHFAKRRTKTRKRTPEFFEQLVKDRAAVRKKYGATTGSKEAEYLIKEFPKSYGPEKYDNVESVRRLFSPKSGRK